MVKSLFSVNLKSAHKLFDEMTESPLLPTQLNLGDNHRFSDIGDKLTSCDGLIIFEDRNFNVVLINPTTREIKKLPQTPNDRLLDFLNTMYGVGYDSSTDDYKVVSISYYVEGFRKRRHEEEEDDEDDVRVNVYSVKNGTWKALDNSPFYHRDADCAGGVYLNGHIHWIAEDPSGRRNVIVAFDLKKLEFWELPSPSLIDTFAHFTVVEGCLCLAPWSLRGDYKYDCFLMKEYNVKDSWTKFTILDHEKMGVKPLCLLGEEQMVLLMDEEGPGEKLVMYNVKEGTSKDVEIQRFPYELAIKGAIVESLLSPHYIYKNDIADEE